MWEEIDVRIPIRSQHPNPSILPDQTVSYRKSFLFLSDIVEGVSRGRVD